VLEPDFMVIFVKE